MFSHTYTYDKYGWPRDAKICKIWVTLRQNVCSIDLNVFITSQLHAHGIARVSAGSGRHTPRFIIPTHRAMPPHSQPELQSGASNFALSPCAPVTRPIIVRLEEETFKFLMTYCKIEISDGLSPSCLVFRRILS